MLNSMALLRVAIAIATLAICIPRVSSLSIWLGNFSRLRWTTSTVHDDKLYIDGGNIVKKSSGVSDEYVLGSTVVIDLSQAWTPAAVQFTQIVDKSLDFPYARFPYLWFDTGKNRFQSVGGYEYDGQFDIWHVSAQKAYHVPEYSYPGLRLEKLRDGNSLWELDPTLPPSIGRLQYGPAVATEDAYYILGSIASFSQNPYETVSGTVIHDFKTNTWFNQTSEQYGSGRSGLNAQAVYAPLFGARGVILYLGGYTVPNNRQIEIGNSTDLQDMFEVFIYDIENGKIISQHTTGPTPPKRWGFMAVGVHDESNGSFDIFIHGGCAGHTYLENYNSELADVWVLSIPSFIWTQIPNSVASMRGIGTAQVAGSSQMIVVGGDDPTSISIAWKIDPWPNGIGIFDLNTWRWKANYDPSAARYSRAPELVRQSKATPYAKFDSKGAEDLFGPPNTGRAHESAAGGYQANVAAIVGGAIGGFAGLAITASLVWYFFFARGNRQQNRIQNPSHSSRNQQNELEYAQANGRAIAIAQQAAQPAYGSGASNLGREQQIRFYDNAADP